MNLLSPRAKSIFRYLSGADPFYKWRMGISTCPACGGRLFLSLKQDPSSVDYTQFMTRCLGCGSNVTNLSLIPVIKKHTHSLKDFEAWEMSTYGATHKFLNSVSTKVIDSEYFPGKRPGELVGSIRNEDVQQLSFENESLDLITSNQVFEHVPDDLAGYAECFRVLRPGGALVFSIPLNNKPSTIKAASLEDGKFVFYMEPEYHDSRMNGPGSALVFWHFSVHDICARINSVGFNARLVDVMISPIQLIPQKVIYAVKPC